MILARNVILHNPSELTTKVGQNSDDESHADSSKGSDDNGGNSDDAAEMIRPGLIPAAAKDPQHNGQWTNDLRYQAFGLLEFRQWRTYLNPTSGCIDDAQLFGRLWSPSGWVPCHWPWRTVSNSKRLRHMF